MGEVPVKSGFPVGSFSGRPYQTFTSALAVLALEWTYSSQLCPPQDSILMFPNFSWDLNLVNVIVEVGET